MQSKTDGHLGPGKQIINNGECTDGDGTSYKLVDTSYSKKYFRKLKGMMMDHEQNKWLSDKMTTIADQVTLYKCPRKKCNVVFSRRKNFFFHMFVHCYIAKKDTGKTYMIAVVYTIPPDTVFIILLLLVTLELKEFGILFFNFKIDKFK